MTGQNYKKILKEELKKLGLKYRVDQIPIFLHPGTYNYVHTITKRKTFLGIPYNGKEVAQITPITYISKEEQVENPLERVKFKGLAIIVHEESERNNLERFADSYKTRTQEDCIIR